MQPIDPDFASGARLGTEQELAAALVLSVFGVRKMLARGVLPAVKIGGARRYHLPTVKARLKVNRELLSPPPVPIIQRRRVVRHRQRRKGTA